MFVARFPLTLIGVILCVICGTSFAGPIDKIPPVCTQGCGENAYCNWPEHCACLDNDYEKIENGVGCRLKEDKHLCLNFTKASEYPVYRLQDSVIEDAYECCQGYERKSSTEPCLRKVEAHECFKFEFVEFNSDDLMDWAISNPLKLGRPQPHYKMERRRVCCEGYERKSADDSTCVPICSNGNCQVNKDTKETSDVTNVNDSSEEEYKDVKILGPWQKIADEFEKLNITFPNLPADEEEEAEDSWDENDPNLCSRELNCTSKKLSPEWQMLKDDFDKLKIPFPENLFPMVEKYCCEGYKKVAHEKLCQPICKLECGPNSYCDKPDQCACKEGYHFNGSQRSCVRKLRFDDKHVCNGTGIFGMAYSCCEGYLQNMESGLCEPICEGCLPNCTCKAPGVCVCPEKPKCECHEGYLKNDITHVCEPQCAIPCPAFSSCKMPNKCGCYEGYIYNSESNICEPVCKQPLPKNSTCTAPGRWECDLGFAKVPIKAGSNEDLTCEPHCIQSCSIYGKCVAPNHCECLPGYTNIAKGFNEKHQLSIESCIPNAEPEDSESTNDKGMEFSFRSSSK